MENPGVGGGAPDQTMPSFIATGPPSNSVSALIHTPESTLMLGDSPTAWVEIRNISDEPILLLCSLDGSSWSGRCPVAYFEVKGPLGGVETIDPLPCITLSPLRLSNFVALDPGSSFDPHKRVDERRCTSDDSLENFRITKPGNYTIVFHYSTDVGEREPRIDMERTADLALLQSLERVPRVSISCSTSLQVREP